METGGKGFMKLTRYLAALILLLATISAAPGSFVSAAAPAQKKQKDGKEEGGKKQDPERALIAIVRGMQMDLEGGSRSGFLSAIDSAKFEDYPRFEDMIDRLSREDSLRVYFRQSSNSIKDDSAQTIVDADMELTRKDSAGQLDRRHQQIVIDFEATSRGWKIVNITPRDFFRPL
jgi:hypothetical protein